MPFCAASSFIRATSCRVRCSEHVPNMFWTIWRARYCVDQAFLYRQYLLSMRYVPKHRSPFSTLPLSEFGGNKPSHHSEVVYGREYAIKCLSKANLDEDALAAQMIESHPNIVTLHRTLETSSFLLLVLEYVPGKDLFYFLEQARDHYDSDPRHSDSRTPPTPSLLSNSNPSQLLSRTRLRLITSMFSKYGWMTLPDGRQERKVIVKLSDFGLSSTDVELSDMDCGSPPYMSYECRNNVTPTYRPRAADVWSLGIVLINMLYHCNPWADTEQGACPSFDLYLHDPVKFFINRFVGMTHSVAEFFGRARHPSGCASTARTPAIPAHTLSRAPSLGPAYEREETNELSTTLDHEPELEDQPARTMDADDAESRSTSSEAQKERHSQNQTVTRNGSLVSARPAASLLQATNLLPRVPSTLVAQVPPLRLWPRTPKMNPGPEVEDLVVHLTRGLNLQKWTPKEPPPLIVTAADDHWLPAQAPSPPATGVLL
ncbi:Protein kinase-like domain containing protein [Amanita muscaria]